MLAAIAYEMDLDICHFDIQQAFVISYLDEDVYKRIPQGCGRMSGKMVKLSKKPVWLGAGIEIMTFVPGVLACCFWASRGMRQIHVFCI